MGFLEDILLGSIAKGVNKPTLFLLNFALCGCILLLVTLVFSAGTPPDVVPHFVVLVFFALGLLGCVNWLVSQTGTVSAKAQKEELFNPPENDQSMKED